MRKYKISDEYIQANVKRQLPIYYGVAIISLITVIIHIFSYATNPDKNFLLLLVTFLFFGFVIFIFLRYTSRLRKLWQFFELEIHETHIVYRNFGIKDRVIDKNEITKIQLISPKGSLIIKTDDVKKQIRIPYQLDSFEEVIQRLSKWQEIQDVSQKKGHSQLVLILSSLGFISVLLLSNSLDSQIAIPGIFLICSSSIAYLFVIQIFSDEFDKNVRRLSWLLLVPVITLLVRIIV
jgi:hypothetical protein